MEERTDTESGRKEEKLKNIKDRFKSYSDFPKPGVNFIDVFPLFQHPSLLPDVVELLHERLIKQYSGKKIDMVVGIDSKGFTFGPELARKLQCDFLPARKKGKLPGETVRQHYDLEYGSDCVEMQKEHLKPGKCAIIVDDLIATGGTMAAVYTLLETSRVEVLECQCIVELPELKGKEKLPKGCPIYCLVDF